MNRYYEELNRYTRDDGLEVVVDKTWEDIHPRDLFEECDVAEICRKIDAGIYDWFMLRVRVLHKGREFGSSHIGGFCYEDAKEVLTDGTAESMIDEAVKEAKREINNLIIELAQFAD